MEAVLSNADPPEYGVATIPLPIPRDQYDRCVDLLKALEIGHVSEADGRLDSLDSAWPVLNRLVCTKINLDELDYHLGSIALAKNELLRAKEILTSEEYTILEDYLRKSEDVSWEKLIK